VGNLTPLECLVEEVELWKNEFAVSVVGILLAEAAGLRLPLQQLHRLRQTVVLAVLLQADWYSHSTAGGPRADALTCREGGHPRWLDPGERVLFCVFITAVPITREGDCVKEGGGGEGDHERERALGLLLCHSPRH
jgi:hypothetical protein